MDEDLEQLLQDFRASDTRREDLLKMLVQHVRNLEGSHQGLHRDYENERESRRRWQDAHDKLERDLTSLKQGAESNCFIQVLIDGDGSYFLEDFLQKGEKGGADAAAELYTTIRQHVDTLYPGLDLPVIVHIYANLGGLSSLYVRNGVLPMQSHLFAFARGFNSSQDMFNLVDVGTGKEGADHKIREMIRIFLANKQCKHVVFGGLHDKGYLTTLRPLAADPDKRQRITLLETLPAQPGFRELGYNIISIPTVFRNEQPQAVVAQSPVRSMAQLAKSSPPAKVKSPTPPNGASSWSTKAATNGTEVIDVSSAKSKPQRYYLVNKDKERLDERLPTVPSSAMESLKRKREQYGNLCNEHYLKGHCSGGIVCKHTHEPKITASEVNALRLMARNLSCPELGWCEDPDCYKGHVCVHYPMGRCLKGENCYMVDSHGIDLKPAEKIYEDGRTESVA